MSVTHAIGGEVAYSGDLPCDEAAHTGTVTAVETDGVNGAQVVTVEFDCGLTQDIPGDELESAE